MSNHKLNQLPNIAENKQFQVSEVNNHLKNAKNAKNININVQMPTSPLPMKDPKSKIQSIRIDQKLLDRIKSQSRNNDLSISNGSIFSNENVFQRQDSSNSDELLKQ